MVPHGLTEKDVDDTGSRGEPMTSSDSLGIICLRMPLVVSVCAKTGIFFI
jgi:hypothetical protein